MRVTRLDINQFRDHMEYNGSTLIWAPRQSGKTYALTRKFIETPNSKMFIPHAGYRMTIKRCLNDLGFPYRYGDVHFMSEGSNGVLRGMRADSIFIDEIDSYREDLGRFCEEVWPSLETGGQIVAISTPNRPRDNSFYDSFFVNQVTIREEGATWHRSAVDRGRRVQEHFEEELFTI